MAKLENETQATLTLTMTAITRLEATMLSHLDEETVVLSSIKMLEQKLKEARYLGWHRGYLCNHAKYMRNPVNVGTLPRIYLRSLIITDYVKRDKHQRAMFIFGREQFVALLVAATESPIWFSILLLTRSPKATTWSL
jgi:hypothetical protein